MANGKFWWEHKKDDKNLAGCLYSTVEEIEGRQKDVHDMNQLHATIYQGHAPTGLAFKNPARRASRYNHDVSKNVVRSVCDTATALIAKVRPKATFSTDGGDWGLQQRAKLLDQAMVGAFNKAKLYPKAQKAFRDSTILGTGCWKLVKRKKDGYVDIERTLVDEIVVDEEECGSNDVPMNLFQVKVVDKIVLQKLFPKYKEEIDKASCDDKREWGSYRVVKPGKVIVLEAWHLPVGGEGGRHIISVKNTVLKDEEWQHEWFPFVFVHWSEPISGFYGQGLAEQLAGRQKNINALYRFIKRAQELIIAPRVFIDASNSVLKFHLTNEIGAVIPTRGGKPPTFYTPQALTQEIYSWLNTLEQGGYDEAGISMASASNRLPAGIESAPAQREYSYKEGQRFAPISQRFEDAIIETASKMVQFYKELNGDGNKVKVTFSNNKFMQAIEWDEVDMQNDQYEIRIDASSLDSLAPAGRIQAVIELAQTGWIEKSEGRRLINHPDLRWSDEVDNAPIDYSNWVIYMICNKGATAAEVPPVAAMEDLEETKRHVRAAYLRAVTGKAPKNITQELLNWMLLAKAATPPPPPMPQAPIMPGMADPAAQGVPTALSQGTIV